MFKRFTGWQWLLINAANLAGRDKLTLEERLKWSEENLNDLEDFGEDAGTDYPQYVTAVKAIRKAQNKESTGLLVTVDAVCSGMQIMSAMSGCVNGAKATGLIDTDKRPDAYRAVTDAMNHKLGGTLSISRDDAKRSVMTLNEGVTI
jgi:DNA-directed RNA polymerase